MLEFSDAPYRFFEARPSAPLIRLGRALNRHLFLPGPNHLIRDLSIDGDLEALAETRGKGDRLLFVINHPSHSDPQALTEVQRRLGVDACFMAAYDVFLRGRLTAWSMQKRRTASRALFVWRWPIPCQRRRLSHSGTFAFASCTWFSPMSN
jgi:hypothetical protein